MMSKKLFALMLVVTMGATATVTAGMRDRLTEWGKSAKSFGSDMLTPVSYSYGDQRQAALDARKAARVMTKREKRDAVLESGTKGDADYVAPVDALDAITETDIDNATKTANESWAKVPSKLNPMNYQYKKAALATDTVLAALVSYLLYRASQTKRGKSVTAAVKNAGQAAWRNTGGALYKKMRRNQAAAQAVS